MAAELGIVAAVTGLVGVSASGLVSKILQVRKRLKDVGDQFKDSSERLSQSLQLALEILKAYRKLEEDRMIYFQTIGDDRRPVFTPLGFAINGLCTCIREANAYLDKLEKKSKGKMFFTDKQIHEKFDKFSEDLQEALSILRSAVQVNEVKERHMTQVVLKDVRLNTEETNEGKCITDFDLQDQKFNPPIIIESSKIVQRNLKIQKVLYRTKNGSILQFWNYLWFFISFFFF